MAYLFQGVNEQLDGQNDPNKQNIFGQGSTPQGASDTGAPTGGEIKKTNTSGAIEGAQGGGEGQPAKSAQVTTQDRQSALNLQAKRQGAPKVTEQVGQKLSGAATGLQNEADQYVKGYKEQDYRQGIDKDILSKAVREGDQDAYSRAFGRVSQKDYGNVNAFAPETQTEFQDVKDLQSKGGIQNLFQSQMGPQYKRSDSAFDAMILARNPEFRNVQQQLQKQQADLITQREAEKVGRTATAQELANAGYQGATEAIKGDLSGIQKEVLSPLEQKAAEETARRQALDYQKIKDDFERQQALELQQQLAATGGFSARASRLLPDVTSQVDINPFATENRQVDWKQFVQDPEAQQFNRIQQLLGTGEQIGAGKLSSEVDFNQQAIRDALVGAATAQRRAQEEEYSKQMQDILNQANARAQQGASLRGQDINSFINPVRDSFLNQDAWQVDPTGMLGGQITHYNRLNETTGGKDQQRAVYSPEERSRMFKQIYSNLVNQAAGKIDPNQFYKKADNITGLDLLDQGQAAELNRLAAETGQTGTTYSAGQQKRMQDEFDRAGYENALRQILLNSYNGGGGGGGLATGGLDERGATFKSSF